MSPEQNALAKLLQERREAAGYSRVRLGKIVGVSAGTIEGWELGRVGRPPFHEVMRIASFLRIAFEDLQRAIFEDAGTVPDPTQHPGTPERRKPGRKKRLGVLPLLEAAFRLYGWQDEGEAAEALGTTPEQVRAWRRGTGRINVADYMALTATVNIALADAMKAGKASEVDLSFVAEAMGMGKARAEAG
ncbi:MAG: helix-turn-helix transcriptional regulator [Gaiellaceae bacterium]